VVITRVLSGLNAALATRSWCASGLVTGLPVVAPHTRAVWSSLAHARSDCFGCMALVAYIVPHALMERRRVERAPISR
jgi:hypothetical protein